MRDDFPMDLLDSVDILVPNETEFAHLVRARFPVDHGSFSEEQIAGLAADELRELCREFGVPTVIITLGGKGCFCSTGETFFTISPLPGIKVVDTTGAGDAFVGGLASGMVQFAGDLRKAAQYGTVVAGLSVTQFGTAPAMPHKDAIASEAAKQGLKL
jgi:ribokinase